MPSLWAGQASAELSGPAGDVPAPVVFLTISVGTMALACRLLPSGFYYWRIDRYWMKDLNTPGGAEGIHHQLAAKHNLWFSFCGVWYIIIRVIK